MHRLHAHIVVHLMVVVALLLSSTIVVGAWHVVPLRINGSALQARPARPVALSLEERVTYQRTIEEVYWQRRIWPQENPTPKPPLDAVLSPAQLRAKVENGLRLSKALEIYWGQPVSGEQLQAELDRMARRSQQPAVLRQLWQTLGNDPYVIAEMLARPLLAERLVREYYAHDGRFHGALKARARADLERVTSADDLRLTSGQYTEFEWIKREGDNASRAEAGTSMLIAAQEWEVPSAMLIACLTWP